MDSCALDASEFETMECEEGILDVVQACNETTLNEYGEAYADFYTCLRSQSYCPDGTGEESMEYCSARFQQSISSLELYCDEPLSGTIIDSREVAQEIEYAPPPSYHHNTRLPRAACVNYNLLIC